MISTIEWSAAPTCDPLTLYRRMWVLRLLDMGLEELRVQGLLAENVRAGLGQEAVAVGASAALRPGDILAATAAGHWEALQAGFSRVPQPATATIADLFERSPIQAIGQAYSQWAAGEGPVILCAITDSELDSPEFDGAAKKIGQWRLPMVIVVESVCHAPNARRGQAARIAHIPVVSIDGKDVAAVRDCVSKAVDRARAGEGPALVEAVTHRTNDFLESKSERYADPLVVARRRLINDGITDRHLDELEEEARCELAEIQNF